MLVSSDLNASPILSCMSFDTTASNTGRNQGACVLIKQVLQKHL